MVLVHDIHVRVPRDIFCNPGKDTVAPRKILRQDKVPDKQPSDRNTVSDNEIPDLPVHLAEVHPS